ncbi:MAG: hypothetical protein U0Z44_11925 [Kouleothrix sp.]
MTIGVYAALIGRRYAVARVSGNAYLRQYGIVCAMVRYERTIARENRHEHNIAAAGKHAAA